MGNTEGSYILPPPNLRGKTKTTKKFHVLELIIEKPHSRKKLLEITKYREKTIDGILSKLVKEGCIKKLKKGVYAYKNYKSKKKKKLIIEICRHGIFNRGYDVDNPINSEVEILLRISNPTKDRIGVSKILVNSKDKDYLIAISMQEVENKYKYISSFFLEPEETKLIMLIESGKHTIFMDKKFVSAVIEIYDTKNQIIKEIPVKLYIGYLGL